jgi:hypothetical protein
LQDLRTLSLNHVDATKLHLLLAGMDIARHTLHAMRLTFVKEKYSVRRAPWEFLNPDIALALEHFTALRCAPIGVLPFGRSP